MKTKNLRLIRTALAASLFCLFGALSAHAQAFFSAVDLDPGSITASVELEGFTLIATEAKGLTVDVLDVARTAPDGEVFNARLKLNGSGSKDYRAVSFTAEAAGTVVIYLNSSSKTDARTLKLTDAEGNALADLSAPPDTGSEAGMVSAEIPQAGTYLLYSGGSGINIYAVSVE